MLDGKATLLCALLNSNSDIFAEGEKVELWHALTVPLPTPITFPIEMFEYNSKVYGPDMEKSKTFHKMLVLVGTLITVSLQVTNKLPYFLVLYGQIKLADVATAFPTYCT